MTIFTVKSHSLILTIVKTGLLIYSDLHLQEKTLICNGLMQVMLFNVMYVVMTVHKPHINPLVGRLKLLHHAG